MVALIDKTTFLLFQDYGHPLIGIGLLLSLGVEFRKVL